MIMKTLSKFGSTLAQARTYVEILSFQEPPAVSSLPSFSHGSVPSKSEALAREKQLKHEYPLFKVGDFVLSFIRQDTLPVVWESGFPT